MDRIIVFFQDLLAENQFFQGGLVLSICGAALVYLRSVPGHIWSWIKFWTLSEITFDDRDQMYGLFLAWLHDTQVVNKKRYIRIQLDDKQEPPEIMIVPDRRRYCVKLNGVWAYLTRYKDDANEDSGQTSGQLVKPEMLSITCFVWQRSALLESLQEIAISYNVQRKNQLMVYQWHWWYWQQKYMQPCRDFSSLILREGMAEEIISDVDKFINSQDWYTKLQMPYQRGYLLVGPPGTGKTSLVVCLASHFKLRLCTINLASVENDSDMNEMFMEIPSRSIILIEDFDSFFNGRKTVRPGHKITFSGFLNAINGAVVSSGRILVMSTNVVSNVDQALIRPGRIDRIFTIDYLDRDQAVQLLLRFVDSRLQDVIDFVDKIIHENISPADLTGHVQRFYHDIDQLLDADLFLESKKKRLDMDKVIHEEELATLKEENE